MSAATTGQRRAHLTTRRHAGQRRASTGSPRSQRLQVVGERLGRAVAAPRLLVQALETDRLQVCVDPGYEHTGTLRVPVCQGGQGLEQAAGAERRVPREQLVEDRAEAVDVDPDGELADPLYQLRSHVHGRPRDGIESRRCAPGSMLACQAEVAEVGPALVVEEDVRGLDIAVQNSPLVGEVQRTGNPGSHPGGVPRCEPPGREPVGEAPALHQPHGEVVVPALVPGLVEWDDVGVVKLGDAARLLPEAPDVFLGRPVPGTDRLECHGPAEGPVPRLVDDPHAAPGDLPDELVLA